MSGLSVRLLGRFSVQSREQILPGFEVRKVQELFSYLLLNRGHSHSRVALAGVLYADRPDAVARKHLRQALWQLRTGLDDGGETAVAQALRVEPEWVELNLAADLWLDVAALEQVFACVEGVPARQLDPPTVCALRAAAELYQGDLLEGWYHDWCHAERERVRGLYLVILDKLVGYCEAHQEYESGLAYGARILRHDRASERTYRRLMRLYYLSGDRTAALRQYDRCVAAMEAELLARPGRQTVALYRQIVEDRLDPPAAGDSDGAASPAGLLLQSAERLDQLRAVLTRLQSHVQEDLQAAELVLHGPC